ncbi:MAG: U32 family peptidase [Burkholderiaceae bacterium]
MTIPAAALELTVGPLQYWWPRPALMALYAEVADSPARHVVLGELVCSRRNEFKLDDWIAIARELAQAGKTVTLATQALVMSEAELRTLRRIVEQDEFAVEAGDASALRALAAAHAARPSRLPFVIGPHVNIYNRAALVEHARLGAGAWVPPLELPIEAVAAINPPQQPVAGAGGAIVTEMFVFGRLPLAFSARCFTARHHRLNKDECDFRCRDDADGLLMCSSTGEPFLVLNGIQTQSAGVQALLAHGDALRAAGVSRVRLSPCSGGFAQVLQVFDAVYNRGGSVREARETLASLALPGALVDGYARARPGMEAITA